MPAELLVLALGVALLLAHIALQGITATAELGSAWNAGPRDEGLTVTGPFAGRAERALKNYLETFPALIGLALALFVTGKTGGWGAAGAWLWLAARVVYIPLYLFGVSYIRSLVWTVSAVGLTIMLVVLIF
jgi:uncharacterized MAPEG superfamily protein